MDPQLPPTAASPVSPSFHQHRHSHQHAERYSNEHNSTYSEKDGHRQQDSHRESRRGRAHDSVISHPLSPKASSPPSPTSSISIPAPHNKRDLEIQSLSSPTSVFYPQQAHIDPEKQAATPLSPRSPGRVSSSNPDVTAILYDSGEYQEKAPEEHALKLLLFLSGPCAGLSFGITLWTLLSLIIALLLAPFYMCTKGPCLGSQIKTFLAPPLNLQLHLIYSCNAATNYSAPMLIVIHLLAPIVAIGVAIGSWTAAFFWFFSAILGDPAGQDGHNDGRDSIVGVRNWWERWLSRALR